jgi:DNA-binding response OmpR family regulator
MEARILIVDEDPWFHGVVRSALSDRGYAITTAADGVVALAKALIDPPSLVLSDVRVPGIDGWRLVRRLRSSRKLADTPFIFLSELCSAEHRRRGLILGADDYLPKPFDPEELALRVAGVLRRCRRERGPVESRGFSGSIEDISLASLLMLLEVERKTGMLVLQRRGSRERCRLFVRDGRIVAAHLDGDSRRQHRELLFSVVGWSAGAFAFRAVPVEVADEVKMSTTHLLLEGTRRIDEAFARAA